MNNERKNVLIIENVNSKVKGVEEYFFENKVGVKRKKDISSALEYIISRIEPISLIFLGMHLPENEGEIKVNRTSGIKILDKLKEENIDIPVVVLSQEYISHDYIEQVYLKTNVSEVGYFLPKLLSLVS